MFNVGSQKGNQVISVRYQVKLKLRFDDILYKAYKAKEQNLRRAGAIVRGIMRRLIKHRKNPRLASPVGTPPYAHFYPGIKNTIEFVAHKNQMIVGPQLTKRNISPVPAALEYGGRTLVDVLQVGQKKGKKKKKPNPFKGLGPNVKMWPGKKYKPKVQQSTFRRYKVAADIRPRPFVNKAFDIFKNSPRYADIWRNCIK